MQIMGAALSSEELIGIWMLTVQPDLSLDPSELLPSTRIVPRRD